MSDIQCYCETSGADGICEVWKPETRRASRAYKCCECGEKIKPDELYEYLFTVFDGQVDTYRTCMFCAAEVDRIMNSGLAPDGYVKGDLACYVVLELRGNHV